MKMNIFTHRFFIQLLLCLGGTQLSGAANQLLAGYFPRDQTIMLHWESEAQKWGHKIWYRLPQSRQSGFATADRQSCLNAGTIPPDAAIGINLLPRRLRDARYGRYAAAYENMLRNERLLEQETGAVHVKAMQAQQAVPASVQVSSHVSEQQVRQPQVQAQPQQTIYSRVQAISQASAQQVRQPQMQERARGDRTSLPSSQPTQPSMNWRGIVATGAGLYGLGEIFFYFYPEKATWIKSKAYQILRSSYQTFLTFKDKSVAGLKKVF